ncbi:hypothetical protein ID866_4656 [Astraeus odoratus]|nr:hypothetical protein ID866_4656 [Astraeus odoratus]
MDVDEVVDTSDVDEREILDVSEADGWILSSRKELHDDTSRLSVTHSDGALETLKRVPYHAINSTVHSPSPRKRLKLSHGSSRRPQSSSLPENIATPVESLHASETLRDPNPSSSQIPDVNQGQLSSESPRAMNYEHIHPSNDISLFSPPPLISRPAPSIDHLDHSSVPSSTSRPPESSHSSRSRSMSSDPWSLFSSPLRRPSTPPRTSQNPPDSSHLVSASPTPQITVQSSPLTPITSPPRPARHRSPSLDELLLLSPVPGPSTVQAPSPRPDSSAQDSRPPLIPEDTELSAVRYSLRRRDPRQLNPYAYDKLLYKQQMRSNPDAIVKFASPTRRSHGHREEYEDESQATYVFPLDNQEEDGDYTETAARRRQRTSGPDADPDTRASGERDIGWLPETLRPLSSSDDDDDEIRRLAKKARREREKAEAKAEADARKARLQERRLTGKRKAFPVPSPSVRQTRPTSQRRISHDLPSPKSSVRARSEPISSPVRPQQRQEPSSRASSHSPIRGSNLPGSPEFNYDDLQDNEFQHFNDFDGPTERDPSPARTYDFDPPTSPSVGNTIPLSIQSHEEPAGDDSNSSSVIELTAKDRKRLRALRRMMPATMVARHLAQPPSHRARTYSPTSSDSEAKEVPLIPGLARVRRSAAYRDVEIRGDTESSDIEQPDEEAQIDKETGVDLSPRSYSSPGSIRIRRASALPAYVNDEVISLSDGTMSSPSDSCTSSDEDSEGDRRLTNLWISHRPSRGPAREKSLIDWMFTRAQGHGEKKRKSRKARSSRKSTRHGAPSLDIVTSGAGRHRQKQQTLLSFVRPTAAGVQPGKKHQSKDRSIERVATSGEMPDAKKKKKRKSNHSTAQGLLYNIHHDGVKITSTHREQRLQKGLGGLVVEDDDIDFHQALDPGWKAEIERWNKDVPLPQPPAGSSKPLSVRQHVPLLSANIVPTVLDRRSSPVALTRSYIVPDMGIHPLRSGVKFSPSTYIGKGTLHQLISVISSQVEPSLPSSCNSRTFVIGPTTSAAELAGILGPLYDQLVDTLRSGDALAVDETKDWERVLQVSCQLLSWLGMQAEDEEFNGLAIAIQEYSNGLLPSLNTLRPSLFSLTVHWFLLELAVRLAASTKYRRGLSTGDGIHKFSRQLVRHMMDIDLQEAFATFHGAESDVETTTLPHRTAELWVCLIHLLNACDVALGGSAEDPSRHLFWHQIAEIYPESSPTGAEASEQMWRTIFSVCALARVSVHGLSTSVSRLPAAWDLVSIALKKIVLTANPDKEKQLPPRALKKRDDYLTCIVSRCFLLWSQWHWRLDEAMPMFKALQEIFRSRNFLNLRNERPTYMGFLERDDLELLSKSDRHDSVFEVFLKMVVQAVHSWNTLDVDSRLKVSNTKKLLQIAVPLSPVPFSKTVPPTDHQLSMLLNRFSAMAVAIHLDPTVQNVRFRVGQARRCVNFKEADDASRIACIYGMMYFAKIIRHHRLPLDEILGWLTDMSNILMDDYKDAESSQKDRAVALTNIAMRNAITLIQLLLGSVRKIIETESLDKIARNEYPDPALLDGPWVTRVFNPGTNLVTLSQTGLEIRMLVQSFLNARSKALPPAQAPLSAPIIQNESQEEYEKVFLELDDAELLAALGDELVTFTATDLRAKEDALCKVLDKSITPAMYRLVCKHLGEIEHGKGQGHDMNVADEWIECWVGCANVLIQNGNKDWSLYMKLGQQSWEKIIDASWRRRVGLRFNLSLLRLDPSAYPKYQDDFISFLLIASVSSKLTIEHEYMSVVFTLDRLQYPLLRGAPFQPVTHTQRFEIGEVEYREKRIELHKSKLSDLYLYIHSEEAMAGLISPRPLSYMQHAGQLNPYQQRFSTSSNMSAYSETPTILQSHQNHILSIQEEGKIYALVIDLLDPNTREAALLELSKKREQYDDLALVLWHSFGIMPALLQEIVSVYPLLSPPNLTAHVSNRVCNALALLQLALSNTFDLPPLGSLQNDNSTVIHFLLSTEIIPLCLRIMETGSELSKTVAIFIVQKILLDETGLTYICHTYERFYAVGTVLSNMVNQLVETQAVRLLKHVVRCYLRLSDNVRAREALRACLPEPLRDQTFSALLKNIFDSVPDTILTVAAPLVAYWTLSLVFHLLDISGWKWLDKYRIHESKEVTSRNRATRSEVFWAVILQHAVQTILGYFWLSNPPHISVAKCQNEMEAVAKALVRTMRWILGSHTAEAFLQRRGAELTHWLYWWGIPAAQVIFALFIIDTWQYFLHRLMHSNKFLYKQLHAVHHRLYVPYAFGALYNHPLEGLILDTCGAAFAEYLAGLSVRQAMFLFAFSTCKTVDDHCGYSFPFDPLQMFSANNADYHDIHHQAIGIKYNFSQPFFVHWDVILGTRLTRKQIEERKQKSKMT